ncbi:MAG: DUF6455 family protein [Nevskiales bacterium]|nr:DUF6455 family protein [Nevskiales bacterium]
MSAAEIRLLVTDLIVLAMMMGLLQVVFMYAVPVHRALWRFADIRRAIREITPMPLRRMLETRGLSLRAYVSNLGFMERHVATTACRNCDSKARCEAVLQGYARADDYGFCANNKSIQRLSEATAG